MGLKTSELYRSRRKSGDELCLRMDASASCQSHGVENV
jgi:hypothetical protein